MANIFKNALVAAGIKSSNGPAGNTKQTERKLKNEVAKLNGSTHTRQTEWKPTKSKKPPDEARAQKNMFNSAIIAACKSNSSASEHSNKSEQQSNKIQEKKLEENHQQPQKSSPTLPSTEVNEPDIPKPNKQPKKIAAKRRKSQSPPPPPKKVVNVPKITAGKSQSPPPLPKKVVSAPKITAGKSQSPPSPPKKAVSAPKITTGKVSKLKKNHQRRRLLQQQQPTCSPSPKTTKIKTKLEDEQQEEKKPIQLPSSSPPEHYIPPGSSKLNSTPKNALNENNAKKVVRKKIKPPMEELPMHATPTKTPRRQMALDRSMYIAPFFTKAYAFSNHFRCYFDVDGRRYSCTEQFYMFYKARVFGDKQSAAEIMRCEEARDMKRIGSSIRHFDTKKWRHVSILVMTIGNMAKYVQNKQLRKLLFETDNAVLVEASPDDTYWGVGISCDSASIRDVPHWLGKNVLGRILTRIREVLKEKEEFRDEWESIRETMRRQTI